MNFIEKTSFGSSMKIRKHSSRLFVFLIAIVAWGCKTQKIASSGAGQTETVKPDTLPKVPDPVFYITSKGDTLLSLEEEVDIAAHPYKKKTVEFIGVGDIMMGTNFPNESYLPPDTAKSLWAPLKDTLRQADITFGNFEGVILTEGGTPKYCKNPKVCYLFRTPEPYIGNLVDCGFDLLSLANNHAGDFGNAGRRNTTAVLDSLDIVSAGLLSRPSAVLKKKGVTVGFAAFSPNVGTQLIHDLDSAIKIVSHLDSVADIVVVSFHGGAEGGKHQHVTRKTERFYGEDRGNVYKFAHAMIDHGADVIFGHGPHVTRAIDIYKNRFITYSMGNFFTYGRFNLRKENGYAPLIKLSVDHEGKFLSGKIVPVYQPDRGGPVLDSRLRAISKIKSLTKEDFPELPISIEDSGIIRYLGN